MKIKLIQVGKSEDSFVSDGIATFKDRTLRYARVEENIVKCPVSASKQGLVHQKIAEGREIMDNIFESDYLVLLDEKGRQYDSKEFALKIEKWRNNSIKNLVFCIGGPFGFSDEVYKRANETISFSKFTFSHQLIRILFWEQLYRAHTILKGEKYHH